MKKVIVFILLSLIIGGCNGQKNKADKLPEIAQKIGKLPVDSTYNPKVDVRVNKQYDDKGNLMRFDSTYSYYYSSPGLNLDRKISSDSLFSNFNSPLAPDYRRLFDQNMNSIFFNDSLFKYDFYNKDYFSRRFDLNMQRFENMFHQMDSLKAGWFNQHYPEGEIKKK